MKQRLLKFTPEELIRTLQGKVAYPTLPTDVELINIKYDAFTKQVLAVIRSDAFEEDIEGMSTLEFTCKPLPQTLTHLSPTPLDTPPKNPITTQATPVLQRPLIQTLTASKQPTPTTNSTCIGVKTLGSKPETNIDTCGFEDEFTKEQRKVLKFVSEGDYVIVKPTQFLKTEWEDINDTVKSIGGKWVKGGTIDYWAIPKYKRQEE